MSKRRSSSRHGIKRFAMLPVDLLWDPAVATLDHAAFRVLVLLASQYRGRNNGALGITAEQAASAGIGSRHTLYRAFAELERRGLIEATYPASRVPPRPAMYALTWFPVNETKYSTERRVPGHEYRNWVPEKISDVH